MTSSTITASDLQASAKRRQGIWTASMMIVLGLLLGVVGLAAAPANATTQISVPGSHGTTVVTLTQR